MTPAILKAVESTSPLDAQTAGQQIAAILASVQGNASVNRDEVNALITTRFSGLLDTVQDMLNQATKPNHVVVTNSVTGEVKVKDCGIVHKNFEKLLKMSSARDQNGNRLNIWLYGPAGTGKTTSAHKIADALALPFYANGALSTSYELMGFVDAGGTYHRTVFREAFEHGGVYLFDEIDSSTPVAIQAFNAALANGMCAFPDGMIKRHPDCVVIAGGNTAGDGATSDYSTRVKLDRAAKDRWTFQDWPIDEDLELAVTPNQEWTKIVQAMRKRAHERELRGHLITPRASFYGAALLAAGLSLDDVKNSVLRKGLSEDQWNQLNG